MFAVLRHRNFALLWVGQLISLIGDWVLIVALPFYTYQLTGSVLQTGGMFLVETLPRVVLGSLAGVFVDRWNRRWTMITADLLRAGVLLLLLFVHTPSLLWLIYVVAFLQSVIGQFFTPAVSAITPVLVGEQHLLEANSLESLTDALTRLIGPPVGGAVLALFGLFSVVLIDSVSFLFSVAMIVLIILPKGELKANSASRSAFSLQQALLKVWREWMNGLEVVRKSETVSSIFVMLGVLMIAQGIINVTLIVFIRQVMHGSALVFGWLITAQGIGSIIGALFVSQVSKFVKPSYLAGVALFIAGVVIWIIVNVPNLTLALVLVALVGFFVVGLFVVSQTLLQQDVGDDYRGRVFGAFGTTISLTTMIGLGFSSVLGDSLGPVLLLDIAGTLFILSAFIGLVMLRNARLKQEEPQQELKTSPAETA